MAIWAIPPDKVINYSKTGDDVDLFSQKVKYCLEEAFVSLKYLHDNMDSSTIGGVSYAINDLKDGETLIYDASTQTFVNKTPDIEQKIGDLQETVVNFSPIIAVAQNNAQKLRHLQRLIENIYLTFDVSGLNPGGYDNLHVATFFGDLNFLDTQRSSFTLNDGKIFGNGAILVTNPIYFEKNVSNAHLIIKHTNILGAGISAEIALYDVLAGENFLPMTKTGTFVDEENSERATTEFIYSGAAGNVATLRLEFSGEFWVDSFACTFDE